MTSIGRRGEKKKKKQNRMRGQGQKRSNFGAHMDFNTKQHNTANNTAIICQAKKEKK